MSAMNRRDKIVRSLGDKKVKVQSQKHLSIIKLITIIFIDTKLSKTVTTTYVRMLPTYSKPEKKPNNCKKSPQQLNVSTNTQCHLVSVIVDGLTSEVPSAIGDGRVTSPHRPVSDVYTVGDVILL